jgi:hypothetical protein
MNAYSLERMADPDHKEYVREYQKRPERAEYKREYRRNQRLDPEYLDKENGSPSNVRDKTLKLTPPKITLQKG